MSVRRLLVLTTATACALLVGMPVATVPAHAFGGAFFPTQSTGNRGVDVHTVQHLLNGQADAGVPADGVFRASTEDAVRAFQEARGLAVDGIVGPNTWSALVPTVRSGDSGPAVRAVQAQLNAKRAAGLAVTGEFGSGTERAVRSFQEHAGIGVDGVVGPVTWKNLLWHYDSPDFGTGLCDQDPDGNGAANWGTAAAIGQLEEAAARFADAEHGRVPLGDIGFEHGGDIPAHGSHERGLDVDVWPIRSDGAQCDAGRITWRSGAYDRDATRRLVREIRDSAPGHVRLILFNDPVLIDEGLVTEYPNHDNHLHVRYCEAVHPSTTYRC